MRVGIVIGGLLFLGKTAWNFWNSSPLLRVAAVEFQGDVPAALAASPGVRAGENIVLIKGRKIALSVLDRFPELEAVRVRRRWDRSVVFDCRRRVPIAMLKMEGVFRGIDRAGIVFPIAAETEAVRVPEVVTREGKSALVGIAGFLSILSVEAPELYSLISRLETDKIPTLRLELLDGTQVHWGPPSAETAGVKARRLMRFRTEYEPRRPSAAVRFVTDDRLVMSADWKKVGDR